MARPLRIDFPGAYHHVMNRAPIGFKVFETDDLCSSFCDIIPEVTERYGITHSRFLIDADPLSPDGQRGQARRLAT